MLDTSSGFCGLNKIPLDWTNWTKSEVSCSLTAKIKNQIFQLKSHKPGKKCKER